MKNLTHVPVLLEEVLEGLAIRPGMHCIDGTVGGGGHAAAILEQSGPDGKLLGLDLDPVAIEIASERLASFTNRVSIKKDSYVHLSDHIDFFGAAPISAILCDLGMSSLQLDDTARGFSFQSSDELSMRFDGDDTGETAHTFLMEASEDTLADIFFTYGEERLAKRIAKEIVTRRTTEDITGEVLRQICEVLYTKSYRGKSTTHPGTRVWQALRIAVNQEFAAIPELIEQALSVLAPGGRLAIITFHSLEDALVKKQFRLRTTAPPPDEHSPLPEVFEPTAKLITRKAIKPSDEEKKENPRSRSAQLRIIEKI